ncbi:hypothetical protein DRP53_06690 [candidate division WOR-3 bacterium]|uniref:Lipid A biosynthesis acyltransferase n=1 Tax=candidate division WOR-3 bacterium TaxID=2052148 RepID=A0A660SGJ7_UNCW3|nr:MAG: hypothetical protein DRP53_06690 [candidate division WOR-3 bacterium]
MRLKRPRVILVRLILELLVRLPDFLAVSFAVGLTISLYYLLTHRRRIMIRRLKYSGLPARLGLRIAYRFGRNLALMSRPRPVVVNGGDFAGTIGVSVHFGPWELIGNALAQKVRFGVIARRYDGDLHHWLRNFRRRLGVETFYPDELLKIRDFLRSGGMIGMMVDGDSLTSRWENARRLATLFGVEVKKGAVVPHRNRIYLLSGVDFHQLVRSYPEHYAWFYLAHN